MLGLKMRQRRLPFVPLMQALLVLVGTCSALSSSTVPPGTGAKNKWQPKITSLEERREKLRGVQRHDSETIGTTGFHHIEFYCGDAKSTAYRFALALGMPITGVTGQSTGNDKCISYGLESGNVRFLLTAPYSMEAVQLSSSSAAARTTTLFDAPRELPSFSQTDAHRFFAKHGLAARAVGVQVQDVASAFAESVQQGAKPVLEPTFVPACRAQQQTLSSVVGGSTSEEEEEQTAGCYMAEVELYGDVVLRYVSFSDEYAHVDTSSTTAPLPFLPHLAPMEGKIARRPTFGLRRIDHAVGNVPDLLAALTYVQSFTGFHEFAEFTSEDVGTVDSGLNSVVLASDSEDVLLPLNEPTQGKRKSQIQTYLEQNEGAGLQHLALKTDNIFETIRLMREAEEELGGFELMKRPSDAYYRELPDRLGDKLTPEQYEQLEDLGILADADDEGILLQIFTKPIGDRPTFFFEIIQRVGCLYRPDNAEDAKEVERPGCGGFGQGNFRELFKAIEEHEKTLKV